MNPKQIDIVQQSFDRISGDRAGVAAAFREKVFERAPELRALFTSDPSTQGDSFMASLSVLLLTLRDLETLTPIAQELARRHVDYGVDAAHYPIVGEALLDTLSAELGDDFTPALRGAWIEAYRLLSDVMIDAAYPGREVAGTPSSGTGPRDCAPPDPVGPPR